MRTRMVIHPIALVIIAVALAGCAGGPPSGHWFIEPEARALFESATVLPDHTYYYLGSSSAPDSIIAIDQRLTLRTRVWAQVDMTAAKLNGWLQWYRTDHHPPGCAYQGGVILTPDGRRAGFWYSRNTINLVYQPEPGVIEVYQPHAAAGLTCGQQDEGLLGGMR